MVAHGTTACCRKPELARNVRKGASGYSVDVNVMLRVESGWRGGREEGAYLVKIILEGSTSTIARKSSFQRRRHRLLGDG